MPINCRCFEKLCKLNVIGYAAGWLGIVWRTVLVAFLSTIIYNLTEYDPSLYWIVFISCLTYFLASIVVNWFFLYGIFKERRHFMLPYLTIIALEIIVGAILASGVMMLLFMINSTAFALYVLLATIIIIGIHLILWINNILLYKDLEKKAMMNKNKIRNTSLTGIGGLDSPNLNSELDP